jgi:hypothetical protein
MQSSEASERRRDVRVHVSPPAQIIRLKTAERIEILNASYRGLFVRTTGNAPQMNELVRIRIELPNTTVDIHAIPVRVVVDAQGRPAFGLRFFALNGEDKRLWESYITNLLAPRRAAA